MFKIPLELREALFSSSLSCFFINSKMFLVFVIHQLKFDNLKYFKHRLSIEYKIRPEATQKFLSQQKLFKFMNYDAAEDLLDFIRCKIKVLKWITENKKPTIKLGLVNRQQARLNISITSDVEARAVHCCCIY